MGLKYIGLSALSGNGYACYTVSERRGTSPQLPFKGGKERSEALGKKASHLGEGL